MGSASGAAAPVEEPLFAGDGPRDARSCPSSDVLFALRVHERKTKEKPLIVVIPKSAARRAVDRNRLRRRVRSVLQGRISGRSGLTVIARPEALRATFNEVRDELLQKTS